MILRFQFSLRPLFGQVTLVGVALVCLQSIGEHAGALMSAWLAEGAAAAIGAAIGLGWRQPEPCALAAAILAIPLALFVHFAIQAIGC